MSGFESQKQKLTHNYDSSSLQDSNSQNKNAGAGIVGSNSGVIKPTGMLKLTADDLNQCIGMLNSL